MNLQEKLKGIAEQRGVDYFGIADLKSVKKFTRGFGGDEIEEYSLAISLGITLPHTVVDGIADREKISARVAYKNQAYDVINLRLDLITSELSSFIQRQGYASYPVPASRRVSDEKIAAIFSHKLAASQAGLGWIGKSCLLITPDNGPRVRWASVLTTAPLKSSGSPVTPKCGNCLECVKICPVNAYTGRNFVPEEPREARYNALKCQTYFSEKKADGDPFACGLCLYVCPHGRKRKFITEKGKV